MTFAHPGCPCSQFQKIIALSKVYLWRVPEDRKTHNNVSHFEKHHVSTLIKMQRTWNILTPNLTFVTTYISSFLWAPEDHLMLGTTHWTSQEIANNTPAASVSGRGRRPGPIYVFNRDMILSNNNKKIKVKNTKASKAKTGNTAISMARST